MKHVMLVATLLALLGCRPSPSSSIAELKLLPPTFHVVKIDGRVTRWHDEEMGVVCYLVQTGTSFNQIQMSCAAVGPGMK
jgi:hypothetical protein